MNLYEEIKECINKKDYAPADEKMTTLLALTLPAYVKKKGTCFSFNHILDAYYYDYFIGKGKEIQYNDVNLSAFYRLQGFIKMQRNQYKEACSAYESALEWNPVDLDALLQLGELYKTMENIDACKEITMTAYNYCCTRATLARFYRNLGFFYLESYKPDLATALYQYSNIFYPSKQAENELVYLEKALKRETPKSSVKEMQDFILSEGLPIGPNADTIGITYRVGQLELEKGNIDNAKDCFTMVYDLTLDEEVKMCLEKLNKN